jgi:hypothetical protein
MTEMYGWPMIKWGLILGLLSTLAYGLVLSFLWTWFVVPLGVRPIETIQAIGLSMTVRFITARVNFDDDDKPKRSEKEQWDRFIGQTIAAFVAPIMVLIGGYILHGFM